MSPHKYQRVDSTELFKGEIHSPEIPGYSDPDFPMLDIADRETSNRALEDSPDLFLEVRSLRELEDKSNKEFADATSSSMGAGMSQWVRVRTQLRQALSVELGRGY
jgi:DNA-directed RNA polymerase specialized sigma24 family protein